jgi:hypothetical protein
MVMAAVTWFALLLPVGARAAGQLVTLVDDDTSAKAQVEKTGSLRVAVNNDPARLPFTRQVISELPSGHQLTTDVLTTVPAGQRLVIETVSVRLELPGGQRALRAELVYQGARFVIPLSFTASYTGVDLFQGVERVELYVDPGVTLFGSWSKSSFSDFARAYFSVSGHYVKL